MKTKKIARILGLGLAAALAFSLGAGIGITPVSADVHEWSTINTPTWEDNVILPGSDLRDMSVSGENGDIVYVIAQLDDECRNPEWDDGGTDDDICGGPPCSLGDYALFKSEDGGVTWSDITENVYGASSLPPCEDNDLTRLYRVAVAPDDPDWVAVVGRAAMDGGDGWRPYWVLASDDGGDNFTFAGEPIDPATSTHLFSVRDVAVSPEVDGIHNIAVAGAASDDTQSNSHGAVFRLEAGTWLSASWENTAYYDGWDDIPTGGPDLPLPGASPSISSNWIIDVEFSPNFDIDDTIVCMGAAYPESFSGDGFLPYIQQGTWGSDNAWNAEAAFTDAILIDDEGEELRTGTNRRCMGLTLPMDYDGTDGGSRVIYCYVDAYNSVTELVGGFLFRVDDGSVSESYGPSGDPLLASIDFHGDADTGKMVVGEYVGWDNDGSPSSGDPIDDILSDELCCLGVNVWHTVELDPCCPNWELACKNPSGPFMAVVSYTPDGDKVYAITGGSSYCFGNGFNWFCPSETEGSPGDETAFSVSLDDGVSFNQLGLIDTDIDRLKDVAVCPDCSVIYLVTYNDGEFGYDFEPDECCISCEDCIDYDPACMHYWLCGCDSVWRSYDNGDTWERIFHGDWTGSEEEGDNLMLRLPCEDTEDCCTIYLGIEDTDEIYYSRDCGQCWTQTPGLPFNDLEDFAVTTENEVHIVSDSGEYSMSTQFGRRWTDTVDLEFDGNGESIVACCNEGLLVIGARNPAQVAYSEDNGETWELTDDLPTDSTGDATVACDPTCPGTIYAAVEEDDNDGGVFRWVIGESTVWDDLGALDIDYEGIAVGRDGTLYAVSDGITVDTSKGCCDEDRYKDDCGDSGYEMYSGVARNLDPCETACCGSEDWDYLFTGLTACGCNDGEDFEEDPNPLKLCGCLSTDTNTVLYVIDDDNYCVDGGEDGNLWTYEDCLAKNVPELVSPVCGEDIPSEPCEGCTNVDINLCWTNICDACYYDIEIATDEDFTQTIGLYSTYWDEHVDLDCYDPADCANPCFLIPNGALQAGTTYYWHVRVSGVETGECVKSHWSETCSFNVMAGAGAGVSLLAPEEGAMGIGIESVAFSWSAVGGATSYSFVFSPNSDLSGALASEELSGTAYTYTGMLDYSTPYFWQVTAWKNGSELSTSDIGTFTTMGEPPPPPEPAPEPTPPPDIVIPPAEQITPTWIIACIIIGAVLIVLVIVFIVRTRRP